MCLLLCGLADKQNYSVSSRYTWFASGLAIHQRIVQQSYLLVTEDDFTKAAGVEKVMVDG